MTADLPDPQRLDACRRALLRKGGQALIVDDDHDLSSLIETLLDGSGFFVTTAHSAWDAQHLLGLSDAPPDQPLKPDVLILDYELGGTTGFELLSRLRQVEAGRGVKVLLITGSSKSIPDTMRLDADAYLRKPFDSVLFLETLIRLLGLES